MASNRKQLASAAGIAPADEVFTLTPHISNEQPAMRAFSVNASGLVAYRSTKGTADVSFYALAGVIYPVSIKFLRVAGTDATGILGYN